MLQFGVFIRSNEAKGDIIDTCKRFHQKIQSGAKIVAAKENEACKGLEVFFDCKSAESELLKRKLLFVGNGVATIHSLTTALILHNACPPEEEDFKTAIRNQIKNFTSTQVLDILKVPFSCENPDIGSGKWIIVLDVPEVDDLDVFKTMGLPEMIFKFPGGCYRTTFYCRLCQRDGHIQFRCLEGTSDQISSLSSNRSNSASSSKELSIVPAINIKQKRYENSDNISPSSVKRPKTSSEDPGPPTKNPSPQDIYPNLYEKAPDTISISTSSSMSESDDEDVIFYPQDTSYNPPIASPEPQPSSSRRLRSPQVQEDQEALKFKKTKKPSSSKRPTDRPRDQKALKSKKINWQTSKSISSDHP